MLEGLRSVTCRLTPDALRQMAGIAEASAKEGGPGLLIVSVGSVSRDGDGEAEVLHVVVEPASRSADLRALAQTVEDLLILFITDDGDHAALDGRIIDHAEGDGFFLRDPVSGADNRFRALGGSDWPRWAARVARWGRCSCGRAIPRPPGRLWRRPVCRWCCRTCRRGAGPMA